MKIEFTEIRSKNQESRKRINIYKNCGLLGKDGKVKCKDIKYLQTQLKKKKNCEV